MLASGCLAATTIDGSADRPELPAGSTRLDCTPSDETMLLILSISSFRRSIGGKGGPSLFDLPHIGHANLHLRGLMTPTDLLAGADANELDRFRERADKASCPCLFLVEPEPHPLGESSQQAAEASSERMQKVLRAAHRMGCSAATFSISGSGGSDTLDRAAKRLKAVSSAAERLDVNLLLHPCEGFTEAPEGITELIKLVGGFRLGSMPDFEAAAASGDPSEYLRRLAPYAPVVVAASREFDAEGRHTAYSLKDCCEALLSVGYDGAIALEYRGEGDVEEGIRQTRDIIEPILFGTET